VYGESKIYMVSDGIIISKNSSAKNLCVKIKFDLDSLFNRYSIDVGRIEFGIISKV